MTLPFTKAFEFTYGQAELLSPLVTRVICENPGPFTFTGSGTYLVGNDILAIIDPGPDDTAHLNALIAAINGRPVSHILVTHTHLDHCGGARKLAIETGAAIYGYGPHPTSREEAAPALDEGGDFGFTPDALLQHGSILQGPDWTLECLHTPGHIGNHMCFSLQEEKALFSGDHIMGWATTVVAPPDGSISEYMESLVLLLNRDETVYYPTHGAPVREPRRLVQGIFDHRLNRDAQILLELEKGARQIMEIVAAIYTDTDKALHLAAGLNVQAHLEAHYRSGRVIKSEEHAFNAQWSLTQIS